MYCTVCRIMAISKSPVATKIKLVVDDYAAEIVRKIFNWKMEGVAVSAIADKLNELAHPFTQRV